MTTSSNTYTSRGSGTSYATPSVSGILALMIEANPDLDPFEMKEILKFTAERKGEPTQPDVDPYWNRDFGWGIVDAYKAVELAIQLRDQELTGAIDVFTQVHLESANYDNESGLYVLSGIAWGQMGSVTEVEYKINDGSWNTVAFEETNGTLGATESFVWTIALDLAKLGLGNNTVRLEELVIRESHCQLSSPFRVKVSPVTTHLGYLKFYILISYSLLLDFY